MGSIIGVAGTVDVPLTEIEVRDKSGRGRTKVMPASRIVKGEVTDNKFYDGVRAVTNYEVLSMDNKAALVQCHTYTGALHISLAIATLHTLCSGVRHQVRAHLAYALQSPILGDHKHASMWHFRPQLLHTNTQRALHINKAKARHLPMFLHAAEVKIPEAVNGRNVIVKAPLPRAFLHAMKLLRLHY